MRPTGVSSSRAAEKLNDLFPSRYTLYQAEHQQGAARALPLITKGIISLKKVQSLVLSIAAGTEWIPEYHFQSRRGKETKSNLQGLPLSSLKA